MHEELSAELSRLNPERRRALELLLAQEEFPVEEAPLVAHGGTGPFPLSFSQQRLWFIHQLAADKSVYNVAWPIGIEGRLDRGALARGLAEIVRRHASLRSRFAVRHGEPVQCVVPEAAAPLPSLDLAALPKAMRRVELRRLLRRAARQPFDLGRAPLLRTILVRTGDGSHVLLLTLHHIVSDGWSAGILLHELAALYSAYRRGLPSPLPELRIQYFDYAIFQRGDAHGAILDAQLTYWKRRLAGLAGGLDLPVDRPRPPVLSFRGALRRFDLPGDLWEGVKTVGRRSGATPFMTLLAAFQVLLFRHTDQVDLPVGIPIANRNRTEVEPLIGLFVNTLVLRGDLADDTTFRALLERVRDSTLEDFDHQDVPFEMLVRALQPERSLDRQPLVQVMFQLQNAPRPALALEGLELSSLDLEPETAPYDLALTLAEGADGLTGYLQYSTDLFDRTTAVRLLERFETLLAGAAAAPDHHLSELPVMRSAEEHQILVEWQGPPGGAPGGGRLDQLFAAQVAASPDAPAAVDRRGGVTYGELDRLASRVAWRLARLGVGPEVVVGLVGDRSVAMVAAMLGILRAGGAYLPLDPLYPRERLVLMLADSRAKVLLVPRRLGAVIEHLLGADDPGERTSDGSAADGGSRDRGAWAGEVVWLDEVLAEEGEPSPLAQAGPENLAYLIYTSGSTGRPKGVAIEHRSAVVLARWAREVFSDDELSGVFASTSICFDLSVFEIFVPLAWGGRVIVGEDALALPSHPAAAEVRLLNTVPSAAAALAATGRLPASVRTVNLAGEPLKRELTDQLYRQPGVERVLNLYGPSEDTTYSTWAAVVRGARRPPSIGRPIAATRAYILDRRLHPVPTGVRGELLLGGEGLARGYLDRAVTTAERFVPDPFAAEPGARLYRTGDLARSLADGQLEYLGRLDAQVKIRGFRIEPEEIEVLLTGLPQVAQAAVLARRDWPVAGEASLVAYWVPAASEAGSEDAVRGFLASRLPAFMMPSTFVRLDALPLTPNGKVDRGALPAPVARPTSTIAHKPPGTRLERTIADLWREVLKIDRVGLYDNFFDLGGHSLRLAQLHALVVERSGHDFPMVELFRHPTVKAQATFLASAAPALAETASDAAPAPGPVRDSPPPATAVAVIGMAGRFPGAANVEELWDNLCRGIESISFFSHRELAAAGVEPELLENPDYVKAKGLLRGADEFDAAFFGISRREAEITDPQQRVFLETVWEALEDAGLDPARHPGRVGVFAGAGLNTYLPSNLAPHPEIRESVSGYQLYVGNDKDFLTTRVSYKLDLRGPSVAVQSACSTSLVAVHLACKSLLDGECDVACAGGVTISFPQEAGYLYQEGGIASPDGHCRAFDERAQGTTFGNGAGVVILKRLDAAVADGFRVRAVIKGSAINNDGAAKVGYTAPSIEGQSRVIAAAQAAAGCPPESITYVETHGTGTPLGDPIEIAALHQVFGTGAGPGSCALGSIKSNVGHLDTAAGVAGLIKAVLTLERRQMPPSIHFERANPRIDFSLGPFWVNTELRDWNPPALPRRAGVSSFGIGGTNAHLVLEEAPAAEPSGPSRSWQLLPLSARSAAGLDAAARNLASHLDSHPELPLADVAFTLQIGRGVFRQRRAVCCRDRDEAIAALRGGDAGRVLDGVQDRRDRPVAFLFPGQGAQRVNMGRQLLVTEPAFRAEVEACAEILRPLLETDLLEILYPPAGDEATSRQLLRHTRFAQPALFVVEYALARLWMSWGVVAQALLGHSVGEYVAACLGGVFSLPDALRLLAVRGRLMDALPGGAMLAVSASVDEVTPLLEGTGLSVAAINEPGRVVVAGPPAAVAALEQRLAHRHTACRRLETSHAFHSPTVEPLMEPFRRELERVRMNPPALPWVSTLTGTWVTSDEAQDPGYWARQMRGTVRFLDAAAALLEEPERILLEVGPGRTLTGFAQRHPGRGEGHSVVSSSPATDGDGPAQAALIEALGRLWLAGAAIDWTAFHSGEHRRRCALPTYPFERQRYSIAPPSSGSSWLGVARQLAAEPPARELSGANDSQLRREVHPSPPEPAVAVDRGRDLRRERLVARVAEIFGELLGTPTEEVDPGASFFALGADSLILLQAAQSIERTFGLRIPFRRLVEEHQSVAGLADHLLLVLPPEPPTATTPPPLGQPALTVPGLTEAAAALAAGAAGDGVLASLVQLMSEQLSLLRAVVAAPASAAEVRASAPPTVSASAAPDATTAAPAVHPTTSAAPPPRAADLPRLAPGYLPDPYVAYREIERGSQGELTPRQQQHLRELIARLGGKTRGSKRMAAESRPFLADERGVAGFRQIWKELQYPIHTRRAGGARVWDVDGNEYVDITMGFGSLLYGHTPPFILEAIQEHLSRGIQIGLLSPLAGRAARLICEMTGLDRAAFFNSGTEAVMVALRLARARTRRTRIAVFAGSYHGWADEVMVRMERTPGGTRTVPMAPGVSPHVSDNVLIFDYCSPTSVEAIRGCAHQLAAVLVEPQQSRRPGFDTGDFLRALRRVTGESGAALIFDEVITGFRMHPGGAQALYGVQADLVTYGKSIGGGIPIGAVAGKRAFMDGVDGGHWQYGDSSYPREETTYIAGTYIKHPLTMAVVCASLEHLRKSGPELQEGLTRRTARLVADLDALFEGQEAPIRMMHFGSLFRFVFERGYPYQDLFFFHLLDNGVYVWEGRACYVSTAHSEEDLEQVKEAARRSVAAMREGGFLPPLRQRPPSEGPLRVPMTEAQTALWAVAQTSPDAARAYHECLEVQLAGDLRQELLSRALQRLVERHEILRTTFSPLGDAQIVHPRMPLHLSSHDLSDLDEESRERSAAEILDRDARESFDFEHGPLVRACLLRLGPGRHVFGLTLHHLITDGLSNGVLLRELGSLYAAERSGGAAELPPAVPFSTFVSWQSERQGVETLARSEAYWLQTFVDPPPPLELPADRPRPAVRSYLGARETVTFGAGLHDRLDAAARSQGTTVFTLLLAGWQLLLHRLSGQDDVVVGVTAAGQLDLGEATPVGYCVSLLPIRSRLRGDPSWGEYLAGVQRMLLDAYEHRDYPFHRLVRRLDLPRSADRSPLVSVLLNLDRVRDGGMRLGDLEARVSSRHNGGAKEDLYLDLTLGDHAIAIACEHDLALFDRATIRRWLGYFETLLEGAVAAPDEPLSRLSLLRPEERRQILAETTSADRVPQPHLCLPQRFEARVDLHPDAVAVTASGHHLTYRGADLAANRLARYLRRLGVEPEVTVGICLRRSADLMVALLAVLKAGGAYVPLDPSYPNRRLEHIVRSSRPAVIVTWSGREDWAAGLARRTLLLDREAPLIDRESDARPLPAAGAGNLAYVLYTSGSTGEPKGVPVPHSALTNCLSSMLERPGLTADDALLAVTTLAFDIAALELFLPLLAGGRVEIVAEGVARDGLELREALARSGATVMQATPSTWRMLLAAEWPGANRFAAICGGEALPRPLADALLSRADALWNVYGPTETTIWSTVERIEAGGGPVTAGHPVADTSLRVLDGHLEVVPPGVVGEIFLGGGGVARGYLGHPRLTAERFVPDPFAAGGRRLYRTGDRGRLRPGGSLEVLGRVDQQVKIHGARLELGEIEAALGRHPGVAQAAAAVHGDEPDDRSLIAYVVPRGPSAPTAAELRAFLQDSLPAPLLPAAFVELKELPLTANGKLDRRALPAPEPAHAPPAEAFAAPLTPAERVLAGIWGEVLGIERVGRLDHFIARGGDSISAVRVAVRAGQLGVRLTPTQIFQRPVLAELAVLVGPAAGAGGVAAAADELPLTPTQRWFFAQELTDPHHWNQSVLLELRHPLPAWSLGRAATSLAAHHDTLRLRFAPARDGWRAFQVPPEEACSFVSIDLSSLAAPARTRALETAAAALQTSLDLTRGPLVRIALFATSDAGPRLLVILHHALTDDASWRFLLADLLAAARQWAGGRRPVLPPPTASFRRWAERLAGFARSAEILGERPFWLDPARAGARPLAVDFSGGVNLEASARTVAVEIDTERTRRLRQQAGRGRIQVSHLVLAALAQSFARRFGAAPLLVDLEGHGREDLFADLDVSRTAGWFTCLYPVLLPAGDGSAAETLSAVSRELRRVPRGGIGFGLLRYPDERGEPATSLRALPRAEVVFNFSARPGAAGTGPSPFRRAREAAGPQRSPRNLRPYLIEIEGWLADDRLWLEFRHSVNLHRPETLAGLARDFEGAIDRLLAADPQEQVHRAESFPAARLSQEQLQRLIARMGRAGR